MAENLTLSLVRFHPESVAGILEGMDCEEAVAHMSEWPCEVAGRVLGHMLPHAAGGVLLALGADRSSELLSAMQTHESVRILQQLSEEQRKGLLAHMDPGLAASMLAIAAWPEHSAGGMMDSRVATLRVHMTVEQAIDVIRRTPPQSLHYLYVVDEGQRLKGVMVMRDMLLAKPQRPIKEIMRTEMTTIPVGLDREHIYGIFEAHGYAVLPVIDEEQRLVGVIRHDAVMDAAVDEAYEDMQRMVGAGGGERVLDPVSLVVKGRLPWLLVNLLTAFLASFVVGLFEPIIAAVTALAVLLPVVAGQSGNSGAQTMAVVMRGLVMGEVRSGVRRRVLVKELLGGAINGVAVAIACGMAVLIWDGRLLLAGVIALAMLVSMALSTVAGAAVPMTIAAWGRDPAQSSSIILSTFTDIIGFLTFLGFAALASSWL